jgi:hypothetical protein
MKMFSPEAGNARSLIFEQHGETLTFTVPSLRVYQAVAISF